MLKDGAEYFEDFAKEEQRKMRGMTKEEQEREDFYRQFRDDGTDLFRKDGIIDDAVFEVKGTVDEVICDCIRKEFRKFALFTGIVALISVLLNNFLKNL